MKPILSSDVVQTATRYVLPALFGYMILSVFSSNVVGRVKIYQRIIKRTEKIEKELKALAYFIHQNPEVGLQEYKACEVQINLLSKHGFAVEEYGGEIYVFGTLAADILTNPEHLENIKKEYTTNRRYP